MAHDVFICYSAEDTSVAEAICAELESKRIGCWMAPRDVPIGTKFADAVIGAIDRSHVLLLILSSSSNDSPHVIGEVDRARTSCIPILPLRIDDVTPSPTMQYYIAMYQWFDAHTPPLAKHLHRLVETIRRLLSQQYFEEGRRTGIPGDQQAITTERLVEAGKGQSSSIGAAYGVKQLLTRMEEPPDKGLILLAGPPGAGKSTFCYRSVLNGLAMDRPVIFVTTDRGPADVLDHLQEGGIDGLPPGTLNFVDAFSQTAGAKSPERPDTVSANCEDLNSISMAITKLWEKIGRNDIFLAFDSLTSPYLFSEKEIFRFIRLFLAKFASEGNSVLALMDEGCGRKEDLVAMMTAADGIIRLEVKNSSRFISVVKHPKMIPTKIEIPDIQMAVSRGMKQTPELVHQYQLLFAQGERTPPIRQVGDYVHTFWLNLASWSGILWDPKGFPTMAYQFNKEAESDYVKNLALLPLHKKLILRIAMPSRFSEVKDMKKASRLAQISMKKIGAAIIEYMEEASKKDEHYFRLYENAWCWGFDNVGVPLSFHACGILASLVRGLEKGNREWNAIETKCIGLGDPYCEIKLVPGETYELDDSLKAIDSYAVENIHERLIKQLNAFLVDGKSLAERPILGSGIWYHWMQHVTCLPALLSERYRTALRMGGAKIGKELGEHLMDAGLNEHQIIKRVIDFIEYCKAGKVIFGETIRIYESSEAFGLQIGEPVCFFTTGFLNGLFSTVKNQHVREQKCVAAGDPYCEWVII